MSQVASFTYLEASHVPMLGFWSKPKPRLFRAPKSDFSAYLREKQLRNLTFTEADGVYVALVFAWLENADSTFGKETDPVIQTVRRNVGGSHWLLVHEDRRYIATIGSPITADAFFGFLKNVGCLSDGFELKAFNSARGYVAERVAEITIDEALLISVA